ncbi:TauD/TfdA family dioxygenase (plasmid) [Sphingobium sp. WTD-1]|jgi:alpha-ketoglutarate-dependent taurine dioxygenase|uniref:TauD/TfdA family dioxygenase n=1 Tax=Sphingobium yanoikuyae TaxID=13690 RepID=A0A9X7UH03_SPHYA|nr:MULTISPECIES: TauD/TfdA family dioxygenase [Sphingobium]QNG49394.1 TauD/TfdA family dioxygenase [Sphingobium yanoikuyae]WIA59101.1 TauD/TfdA family dioxygenase [Sphingobium sp. WTD-1]
MATTTLSRLRAEEIKPKIGSRVLNTKEELLSGRLTDEINELLEQRGVLVFKQLHFTDDEQIAFTNALGGNATEIGFRNKAVFPISLDKSINQEVVEYLKGSLFWHIDGTMNDVPVRGSILTSKVLPTWGGNTEFANCYAAYDDLPDETKARIDGLRVVHTMWASQLYHTPEPTLKQLTDWQSRGQGKRELPLVWKHKSGRKSLVLGNTAQYVVGVDAEESARILHGLREFATSEPYHYSHEWEVGDSVMWDNTGTLHRAMPYDPDCGRLLHRTILQGDEPFA